MKLDPATPRAHIFLRHHFCDNKINGLQIMIAFARPNVYPWNGYPSFYVLNKNVIYSLNRKDLAINYINKFLLHEKRFLYSKNIDQICSRIDIEEIRKILLQ